MDVAHSSVEVCRNTFANDGKDPTMAMTRAIDRDPEDVVAGRPAARTRPRSTVSPMQVRAKSGRPVRAVFMSATPWWWLAPSIIRGLIAVGTLPFKFLIGLAEVALAVAVMGIVGTVSAWYLGYIPDEQVIQTLRPVGDRLISIVTGSLEPR